MSPLLYHEKPYPRFKFTPEPTCCMQRLELYGDDVLEVVGDGESASYEWIIWSDGHCARHSDDGFGSVLAAVRAGLSAYDA